MSLTRNQATTKMMQFITAKWISKPIYVVTKLGIAEILSDGPKTIEEIAQRSNSNTTNLYRVMRALASFGIFSEIESKTFALTPMAECLKSGAMRSIALMFLSDWHDKAWDKLLYSVQTGEIAFIAAHGIPCFNWLKVNHEAAEIYNEANFIKAKVTHSAIIDSYDFTKINTIADIGGGYGGLIIKILEAYPSITGIIADDPYVFQNTKKIINTHGLDERCKTINCNFFKEIPSGYDAYLMSHILHDWNDEQCSIILKNCHKAMHVESKLLIIEMIVPMGNEPSISKLMDLEVLVMGGGGERTKGEFCNLITSSGFSLDRIIPTRENISVIECSKK
jgi:hypothetical protein